MKRILYICLLGINVPISAFAAECVIDTLTEATVPADRTRKILGVGEKVTLTAHSDPGDSVSWVLSPIGAGELSSLTGNPVTYTAFEKADPSSVTISATYDGCLSGVSVTFTIFEPTSERVDYHFKLPLPPHAPGLSVQYNPIIVLPNDVSFKNVECKELPGPASSIWGYLENKVPDELYHWPNGNWSGLGEYNNWSDIAFFAIAEEPLPWAPGGGYTWIIPVRWRVIGKTHIGSLPDRTHVVSFTEDGRVTIEKFGIPNSRP